MQSLQAQSTGEDSNSSDTVASDAGDAAMDGMNNGSMDRIDHSRAPSFANSFLGLQNLPGLLPGPSQMPDNFGESHKELFFQFSLRFINKLNNVLDTTREISFPLYAISSADIK